MAITTDPAYPLPGATVTLARTGGVGLYTEYELTVKPSKSTLKTGLLRDLKGGPVDTFKPDVQGAYTFRALEYVEYSGAGSSSPTDVVGAARKELRGSQTGTVYVCASLELYIATMYGHGATLQLKVHDDTVRSADLVKPSTELARLAALQPDVVAAIAALVGVAAAPGALGEVFIADVNALAACYDKHRGTGSPVHEDDADAINALKRKDAYSIQAALDRLFELAGLLEAHMRQGFDAGAWHSEDDSKNLPVAARGQSLFGGVVLLADLRERVFERHRAQIASPAAHGAADEDLGSAMIPPLPLTVAIVAYLDALAAENPTAPAGEQQGVSGLAHGLGFKLAG